MQYADAVAVLRTISLFAELDPATRKLLAFSSSYLTFQAGEALFHQGSPTDSVYVIDDGEVDVIVERDGHEVVVARLGRHDLFGEIGVFRNAPRSATIRAVGAVKVLKIDADVFLKAVTANGEAALAVMRILSDKLIAMTQRFEVLKEAFDKARP